MNYNPAKAHIYLIRAKNHNYYKIGYTSGDVSGRLNNIRISCPFHIYPAGVYLVKKPKQVEKYLHTKLKQWHMHGEWFELPEDVLDEVCSSLTAINLGCNCSKMCRDEYIPRKDKCMNDEIAAWYKDLRSRHYLIKKTADIAEEDLGIWKGLTNKTDWLHQKLQEEKELQGGTK